MVKKLNGHNVRFSDEQARYIARIAEALGTSNSGAIRIILDWAVMRFGEVAVIEAIKAMQNDSLAE